MDVYHTPEIFSRRMSYKSQQWKDTFAPKSSNKENSGWNILFNSDENDDTNLNETYDDFIKNSSLKTSTLKFRLSKNKTPKSCQIQIKTDAELQLVKVKMLDVSPEKPKIISINTTIKNVGATKDDSLVHTLQDSHIRTPSANIDNFKHPFEKENDKNLNNINEKNNKHNKGISSPEKVKLLHQVLLNEKLLRSAHTTPFDSKITEKKVQPIHGITAILNKLQSSNNEILTVPPTDLNTSAIVKQLVMDRFIMNINKSQAKLKPVSNVRITSVELKKNVPITTVLNVKSHNEDFIENEQVKINQNEETIKKIDYPELNRSIEDKNFDKNSQENLNENSTNDHTFYNDKKLITMNNSRSTNVTYDVENFLEDALGDDLYMTTQTNSDITFISNISVPAAKPGNISVSTVEASVLLSDQGTNSSPESTKSAKFELSVANQSKEISDTDTKIMNLMHKAAEQHHYMRQSSKALSICRVKKEFSNGHEAVEAERVLLLAVLRNRAILNEINKIDYEDDEKCLQKGSIQISKIQVPLEERFYNSEYKQSSQFTHWFMCVAFSGAQVYATDAIQIPENGILKFFECFEFYGLPPDFMLHVHVYCLEQRKNRTSSSKHSEKEAKGSKCSLSKNLFKKQSKQHINFGHCSGENIQTPSFQLVGSTFINLKTLRSPYRRLLENKHAYLRGIIEVDFQTKLQILLKHEGFLTLGSESEGLPYWSRQWCLLEGSSLKFWNYPSDKDDKEPLGEIDLKSCISSWIQMVDSRYCAKPKTLLLETSRPKRSNDRDSLVLECRPTYTIVRHFLSCDNETDLKEWSKHLNNVVGSLRNWAIY